MSYQIIIKLIVINNNNTQSNLIKDYYNNINGIYNYPNNLIIQKFIGSISIGNIPYIHHGYINSYFDPHLNYRLQHYCNLKYNNCKRNTKIDYNKQYDKILFY